jgi:hypothetical protein
MSHVDQSCKRLGSYVATLVGAYRPFRVPAGADSDFGISQADLGGAIAACPQDHRIKAQEADINNSDLRGRDASPEGQKASTPLCTALRGLKMSREQDNKAIVGHWFDRFWDNPWKPEIIDELAAPDMLLQYSLHARAAGVTT